MGGRLAGEFNSYDEDFDPYVNQMRQKAQSSQIGSTMDTLQGGLSMAGMLPGVGAIPDLINAGVYAARGKWGDAALSGVMAIPFLGDLVGAGKMAKTGGEFAENSLKLGTRGMGY